MIASNMHRELVVWLFASMIGGAASGADIQAMKPHRLHTFSSIEFNRDAGDFYGLELTVVQFSGGTSMLWRMASGKILPPVLVPATPITGGWRFDLPYGEDAAGEWTLRVSGKGAIAEGPRGLRFRLMRRDQN